MAAEVLESAVSLAVVPINRSLDHDCPVGAGAGEDTVNIVNPDADRVAESPRVGGPAPPSHICDYHRTVAADGHLCPMGLTNSRALDEAESHGQKSTAARTSGYTRIGTTVVGGTERLIVTGVPSLGPRQDERAAH